MCKPFYIEIEFLWFSTAHNSIQVESSIVAGLPLNLDSSWIASGPVQISGLAEMASQRNSISLLPSEVEKNSISLLSSFPLGLRLHQSKCIGWGEKPSQHNSICVLPSYIEKKSISVASISVHT